jgi:hypothetical protein
MRVCVFMRSAKRRGAIRKFGRNRGPANGALLQRPDGEIIEVEEKLMGFMDEEDRVRRLVS